MSRIETPNIKITNSSIYDLKINQDKDPSEN